MRLMRFIFCALTCVFVCKAAAIAQMAAPVVRIVNQIDERDLVTLKGNTHPAANARNDSGRVSPDLPMTDLILVLSRDPEQQGAFEAFVAGQYDSQSPNFHQWLTPEQVGANFGPSETDIATVSNWLTGHGFSIGQVMKDRMSIRFSGTAAQVEGTFHTEIHNLSVKGVTHIGNMSDPQIPSGLTPVVVGVKSLHNFFARPLHRLGSNVTRNSTTGKWQRMAQPATTPRPQFGVSVTGNSPIEDIAPYDFATIYNIAPLWTAKTPIDGTGEVIAIAGTSNIVLSDVTNFRSTFGLPAYTSFNQPLVISGNSEPLTVCTSTSANAQCGIGDLTENSLDVEWAGAVAKGANIVLVASYPSSAADDNLFDSESTIVNSRTASIMNVSYGACEFNLGTAGNVEYYNLWQTAATEGISVFVASGDAGSADCDAGLDANGTPYVAEYGLSVNGLASTPYNTSVGGTDLNWCPLTSTDNCATEAAKYWSSTNASNGSNAIGYMPEVAWNDTCANPLLLPVLEADAGTGGGVTDVESACNYAYSSAGLAFLVDVVGAGGGASGCVVGDGVNVSSCASTTTTTGAAHGSIPLANDGWPKPAWQTGVSGIPSDGVRDVPDVSFAASNGFLNSAYLICVSALDAKDAACSYSASSEPSAQEIGGTSVASATMAGVMALIDQKTGAAQGSPNTDLYELASKQTYSGCSAENSTASNGCLFNDIDQGTIAMPCDYGTPGGILSPNCSVLHSGDKVGILPGYDAAAGYDQATGLGSLNVANVVGAWPAATKGTTAATVTVTPASGSIAASSALNVVVTVAASGGSTPTGTVTLSGGGYSAPAEMLSSTGTYTFAIPGGSLSASSDTLTVTYNGDSTYASETGTTAVTVTAAATGSSAATVTVTPAQTSITASSPLNVAVTVASSTAGGTTPTGTVTLTGGGYTSSAEPLSGGTYTFAIPANSLSTGSPDTLTVTYSGDSTYASETGTATVTVTAGTSSGASFTLAATTVSVAPGATTTNTSTITVTGSGGYAGSVTLACALTSSPSSAVDVPTCTITGSPVSLTSAAPSGTATATIGTTAATTSQLTRPKPHENGQEWIGGGGAVLAFLVFLGIPARRRGWRSTMGVFAIMMALGCLSGCGDFWQAPSGSSAAGTTAGTYTFTVTGTGTPAVSPAPTATITVTVT